MKRVYICIDLKSFYASVECSLRNLDPLNTNLVVADASRTAKTICLAVSPSLKKYGIPGRARLFEVLQKVKEVNKYRLLNSDEHKFEGESYFDDELTNNKNLKLSFIIAPPQMGKYMEFSSMIYNTYLKYISSDDIFPYSIDEIFADVTGYLNTYKTTPEKLVTQMIKDVYNQTGITATAGIGTNMYLAKIAMDIVAKHKNANELGVRIACLDEMSYRKELWNHRPLTDFWRVGRGYANKLAEYRIYTMGDIARLSLHNEDLLYKLFGVNAELLIDHAWGYEPCTMQDVKNYKPSTNSISSGQVLSCPYNYNDANLVVMEMADLLSLDLAKKNLVTKQLVLTIEYDVKNVKQEIYKGETKIDHYGREIPKHAHGTFNLDTYTCSTKLITNGFKKLYENIVDKNLLIRKIYLVAANTLDSNDEKIKNNQINLFDIAYDNFENENSTIIYDNKRKIETYNKDSKKANIEYVNTEAEEKIAKENNLQKTILEIKNKYGKNAILKGMNFEKAGTTIKRNKEIGGHKA